MKIKLWIFALLMGTCLLPSIAESQLISVPVNRLTTINATIYNVRDFGALGNGTTDDTFAIKAAESAAVAKGGALVYFPSGTYLISSTLTIAGGITWQGQGVGSTTIMLANNSNCDMVQTSTWATDDLTSNLGQGNFKITDITFNGNRSNQTYTNLMSGAGLRLYGYNYLLENLIVTMCAADGLYSEWNYTSTILTTTGMETSVAHCKFINNGGNGVYWFGPNDSQTNNCIYAFNGSNIHATGSAGLYVANNGRSATTAAISGGAVVGLACCGSGYAQGTTVNIGNSSSGSGAVLIATITGGAVTGVSVLNGGTGYTAPTINFQDAWGTGATATATITSGVITSVAVNTGGSGYTQAPTISFSGGGGSGATAYLVCQGGCITSVVITNYGTGYASAPICTINGTGTGAFAVATLVGSVVGAISLGYPGNVFRTAPTVAITGGGGTGATATATVLNGQIVSYSVTGGTGYTSAPSVAISGGSQMTGTGGSGLLVSQCHAYGNDYGMHLLANAVLVGDVIEGSTAACVVIDSYGTSLDGCTVYDQYGNFYQPIGVQIGSLLSDCNSCIVSNCAISYCPFASLYIRSSSGNNVFCHNRITDAATGAFAYILGAFSVGDIYDNVANTVGLNNLPVYGGSSRYLAGRTIIDAGANPTGFLVENTYSTGLFGVNTSSGSVFLENNASLTIYKGSTATQTFGVDGATGHILTGGYCPTIAAGVQASSASIPYSNSNDTGGQFQFVTLATGMAPGTAATITYQTAFSSAPKSVILQALDSHAATVGAYISSMGTTSFTVALAGTPTASTIYHFAYWCIQ